MLIAFFGGAAGMVGLTRKEKTTLIPGVAIATALMPPLCMAGYGLATGQWRFFFGAFYLFTINGVFIAFATLVIARVLRLPLHAYADEAARRRGRLWIGAAVTVTLLPSIVLAMQLVRDEWFVTRAGRYLASLEASHKNLVLLSRDIDARRHRISVTLLGSGITPELQRGLEAQLPEFGLQEARLEIRHATEVPRDAAGGGQAWALQQDMQRQAMLQLQEKQARLEVLEQQIRQVDAEGADHARLAQEISAQWPAARGVSVARSAGGVPAARRLLVVIDAPHAVPAAEVQRLRRWLAVRLQDAEFVLVVGKAAG